MPKKVNYRGAMGIEEPRESPKGSISRLKGERVAIVLSPNTTAMVDFDDTVKEKGNALNDYFSGGVDARNVMHDSASSMLRLAAMLKTSFPEARLAGTLADAERMNPASTIVVDFFNEATTEGFLAPTAVVTTWEARFDFVVPGMPRRVHRTVESIVTAKCPPPNMGGSTAFAACDVGARDKMLDQLRRHLEAAMQGS